MLDILTIVHSFADVQTASRIRRTCRRLGVLTLQPILYTMFEHSYEYRVGNKLHRLDGPAAGYICEGDDWYRGGIKHREYHPQLINIYYRKYKVDGLYHREAGPSIIYKNSEEWYFRDKPHRKTGPAYTLAGHVWYTLGKLHRLDGLAYAYLYSIRGVTHSISNVMHDTWIVNGVIIRK